MKKTSILLVSILLTKLLIAQCNTDLDFCDGDYYFNETIELNEYQKVKGTGNTNLYFSCNTGFTTNYVIDTVKILLKDVASGDNYISSTINCVDGDILYMSGLYNELIIVDSACNGIVYFKDRLTYDYKVGDSLQKRDYLKGIEISGVNIYMNGEESNIGMNLRGCRDIKISNVRVYNATHTGIYCFEWYGGIIENCFISNNIRSGYGYGIAICDGSYYVNIVNNNIEKSKHCITFGGNKGTNRFCNVIDNHVVGSEVGSGIVMDTHDNAEYITFSRNTVKGGLIGFGNRGSFITVSDNIIYGSFKGYESCTGTNNIIENNKFYNTYIGIVTYLGSQSIIGNEIFSYREYSQGLNFSYESDTVNSRDGIIISDNKIQAETPIYFRDNIRNVIITNNELLGTNTNSAGIIFITAKTDLENQNFIIKNNIFKNFYNAIEFWGDYKYANIKDNIIKNSNTLIYVNETRGDCNYFDVQDNFIEVENFTNNAKTSNWIISNKWINN